MHPYATDSIERRDAILALALLSVVVPLGLERVLNLADVNYPRWVDFPSVMTTFGILYAVFDNRAWRWSLCRRIGLVRVPVLEGTWTGRLVTSRDGHGREQLVTAKVAQRWTRISKMNPRGKKGIVEPSSSLMFWVSCLPVLADFLCHCNLSAVPLRFDIRLFRIGQEEKIRSVMYCIKHAIFSASCESC